MKKLFLSVAALSLLSSTSVFANDVSLGINVGGGDPPSASLQIGEPAVIVAQPQTVIVERPEGYDDHHRDHDRRYWEARKEEERHREHERRERREHERHDHDDHHHDHDNHHDHRDEVY